QIIRETLWDKVDSAVLTSATLGGSNDFQFIRAQLGIPEDRLKTLKLPTPFHVREQAMVVIPEDAPPVNDGRYIAALADFIEHTAGPLGGRTLVLTTSYRMLQDLAQALRPQLNARGIVTLAQGVDGSGQRLVDRFRQESAAVMLGTQSFWEGVDVPGADLSMVIMARLPFPAPGDPLEEARHEQLQARGISPFYHRTLPQAIIRFQQGFGRLLRSNDDRGVVVVFDRRILPQATRYGRQFLDALPRPKVVMVSMNEAVQEIADFFAAH
ncbi:MAG: DNA polymerase III, partial [Firmicutes bacterium]|nr:DNA polymerase III [Bacillota bacterium]